MLIKFFLTKICLKLDLRIKPFPSFKLAIFRRNSGFIYTNEIIFDVFSIYTRKTKEWEE